MQGHGRDTRWMLLERVCIITHTTWIFKSSTVFLYMCFLALLLNLPCWKYCPYRITNNIALFKHAFPLFLSTAKWQFKIPKDALLFSQILISALHPYAVLPLLLKRHSVWAGERSVSWAFPGRQVPACCQRWASREGQRRWAGPRQQRAEPPHMYLFFKMTNRDNGFYCDKQ